MPRERCTSSRSSSSLCAFSSSSVVGMPRSRISSCASQSRNRMKGPNNDEEHPHGPGHDEGHALGAGQRVRLRDDLADHDVQDRDHDEREDHGERRRDARRHLPDEILEQPRHRRLADGAESQRADRDAELHRGDEVRWVGDDLAAPCGRACRPVRPARRAACDGPRRTRTPRPRRTRSRGLRRRRSRARARSRRSCNSPGVCSPRSSARVVLGGTAQGHYPPV